MKKTGQHAFENNENYSSHCFPLGKTAGAPLILWRQDVGAWDL